MCAMWRRKPVKPRAMMLPPMSKRCAAMSVRISFLWCWRIPHSAAKPPGVGVDWVRLPADEPPRLLSHDQGSGRQPESLATRPKQTGASLDGVGERMNSETPPWHVRHLFRGAVSGRSHGEFIARYHAGIGMIVGSTTEALGCQGLLAPPAQPRRQAAVHRRRARSERQLSRQRTGRCGSKPG